MAVVKLLAWWPCDIEVTGSLLVLLHENPQEFGVSTNIPGEKISLCCAAYNGSGVGVAWETSTG